jgi:hypothetical protein
LAAAVVLLLIIGSGIAFVGLLLLIVGAGGASFFPAGSVSGAVALLGVLSAWSAAVTFAAAVGLWLRRPWGWTGSLAIALASVLGAVIALSTSVSQPPLAAGLVLTLATAALLLAPSTRTASGIG